MSARNTASPPVRQNKIRYPREFLLENGTRSSGFTTESFESIRGREVSRFDGDGSYFKTKIVEEVSSEETARKIMESGQTEDIARSLASQDFEGNAGRGSKAEEEAAGISVGRGEDVKDDDYLAPCEGTFPVCCAADLSPEFMNRFITQNLYGDMSFIVLVDSLDSYYEAATKTLVRHSSSTSSPFKGRTPHECYLLLRHLVRNTKSPIDWEQSIIVDERSLQDDTIILVTIPPEDGEEAMWVRAASHLASKVLLSCSSGKVDLEEIIAEVHKEQGVNGVLRTF